MPQQCPVYGKMCAGCRKMDHFRKVCRSKRDHVVLEVEVKMVQESQGDKVETVSIDLVHLNKGQSVITAHLETHAGKSIVEIPYKIDTGREGNIMPLYIFKTLFKNITVEQLKKSIKSHIRLCMYNKTNIMQLGTCVVIIKFKNIKKTCVFCRNGRPLLRMPDATSLNIININIDSIQAEMAEYKTNTGQEMQTVSEGCTNMGADAITKQDANGQKDQKTRNKPINYFFSSNNTDADKRKSSKMIQKIHDVFGNVFNGIGCFRGTFSLQLKPDSKPYQPPPRHVAYVLQKPFKEELECLQKMDIITPPGVGEIAEWCNSFVLVPKANSKVRLCLEPV